MVESLVSGLSLFLLSIISSWGYWGIYFLMTLESADIPVPSEVVLPFAGFLVSQGQFNFLGVVLAGALGNLVGSLINYGLAYRYGLRAATFLSKIRLMSAEELSRATNWFHRRGLAAIFFGRFLPVVRTFISFPAGMFQVDLRRFSALTFIGSFLWSAMLVYIGYSTGSNWLLLEPYFRQFDYLVLIAIAAAILFELKRRFGQNKK
jgi:membrane protein DedA with SNARE-associated domain